jgi:hypothetical protein
VEPTGLFPVIVLLFLVAVGYGGWALPGFSAGRGAPSGFRERFFAAGRAGYGAGVTMDARWLVPAVNH